MKDIPQMADTQLTYLDRHSVVPGGDRYFDWVEVKRFELGEPVPSAQQALDALLAHVRFRDTFITQGSEDEDSIDIHGPYRLEAITPESYETVTADEARLTFQRFAERYASPEEAALRRAVMASKILPVLDGADACFRLRDLGEAAQYDCGWILDDFTEVVAIHREARTLSLVVAGED